MAQFGGIGDHDLGGGPLVDVLQLEAQIGGFELHHCREKEGGEECEEKGRKTGRHHRPYIHEQGSQELNCDKTPLHEFYPFVHLVIGEHDCHQQAHRAQV